MCEGVRVCFLFLFCFSSHPGMGNKGTDSLLWGNMLHNESVLI